MLKDLLEKVERLVQAEPSWSLLQAVKNNHTTLKMMEARMERFLQEGCETVRHIAGVFDEYDLELSHGSVRWALRRLLEEQSAWSSARLRFGELGSREAFALVVEAGVRRCRSDIESLRWRASQDWVEKTERVENMKEAERLEKNIHHLQTHVKLFEGAPHVKDVQLEMQKLMKAFLESKGVAEAFGEDFFTTATAFLSKDLQAYEGTGAC